jgi:hypothetical protein
MGPLASSMFKCKCLDEKLLEKEGERKKSVAVGRDGKLEQ